MKEAFKQVRGDKIIRTAMASAFALLVLHTLYIALYFSSLPPVLPLYNQMPWGDTRLGSRLEIFIPLALSTLFFMFNFFLLARLYMNMPLVSRIISITTLLISLLSIIFIVRTLLLIL